MVLQPNLGEYLRRNIECYNCSSFMKYVRPLDNGDTQGPVK